MLWPFLGQAGFPVIQTSVVLLSVMEGLDSAVIVSLHFFCTGWRLLKLYDKSVLLASAIGKIGVIGVV